MAVKKVMSKYDYVFAEPRTIDESTVTVPDLVLSMADIYRKYAITGDISQLPGKVRPITVDNGDEFDDFFDSEEMTDSLLHARELRARASMEQANPASEDIPQEEKDTSKEVSPKPQTQSVASDVSNDDKERSDAKE